MKIVLIEPLGVDQEVLVSLSAFLEEAGHEFVSYDNRVEDTPTLIERAKDADAVILTNLPFKKKVMEACTNLKMISVAFTGVDHVDVAYCKDNDILVSNAAGYSTNAVAELAIGLIIGVYRRLLACDDRTRSAQTKNGLIGFEMAGKRIGVIGTGAIGGKVMEIAMAFGCEVVAYSRSERQEWLDKGVKYLSLEALLKTSDIVSLHIPLTESSKGLIGEEELAMMKKSAILINTARGPVVDSAALAQALKEGKIAGAGIDVFEMEPPIPMDHVLMDAPNTILTPHVAFATKESLVKRAIITFDSVEAWLGGNPLNII